MSSFYGNGGGGSGGNSGSTFDLSDRIAKGVNANNGAVLDGAVVEGDITHNKASNIYAHAEGNQTTASGNQSHAEGRYTKASGFSSHAEGQGTTASGLHSHAEGQDTTASGAVSHAEGNQTTASGNYSHAEGQITTASGLYSHTEGTRTTANHKSQHVFGEYNVADNSTATATNRGKYVEIVGNGTTENSRSNARTLDWSGNETLAGKLTVGAAPVNDMDVATKKYVDNKAGGSSFNLSDRIKKGVNSSGDVVNGAIVEGNITHNKASNIYAHAEGWYTTASGTQSHAEGGGTIASGTQSHAEGGSTTASGAQSHAEGGQTRASGTQSHAEGGNTIANHKSQHVFGEFNIADDSTAAADTRGNYVEIVGNGTSSTNSNARTLDWSGNEKLAGSLTLGMGTADEVTITATQLTALLALLNT